MPDYEDGKIEISPDPQAYRAYDLYARAKAYRRNFDQDWDRFYRFYAGRQWEGPVPEWKTKITVNFIFSTIETIVPIMTDTRPQIVVAPQEPSDYQIAEIHSHIQRNIWDYNDMDVRLPSAVRGALIFGNYFIKPWWDKNAQGGLGEVRYALLDPFHVFPSPGALSIEDAAYVAVAMNVPLGFIISSYPEAEGKIRPGIWDSALTLARDITSSKDTPIPLPEARDTVRVISQREDEAGEYATLIELWERDYEGRVYLSVCANGVVLKDREPSPYRYEGIPIAHLVDHQIPGSFWGMGEVQQLIPLQESINRRRSQVIDLLRLYGQPPLIADENSGVNPMAIAGRPGAIIYKNQGSQITWLQPPPVPGALFEIQVQDKRDFESISGIYDVTQGRPPTGVEAAAAILALQEAAQTRIRLKVRNLESFIAKLGKISVSLVQQFYTAPRAIRIFGPGNETKFISINTVRERYGQLVKINDVTVGKFDVKVGAGSTLPVSRAARANQMKELYQLGIVDAQAVLEYSGIPIEEARAIVERMKASQQQPQA